MALAAEDIEFIKAHIGEWLAEESLGKPPKVYELELRERSLRIEEQLKHQRDLIQTIIEQNDKRFETLQIQLDKRFDAMQDQLDKRFDAMQAQMDKRFESVDKRFESMDKRFESMDKRFEALTRRIDRFMFWSLGLTISVAGLIIAMLRLWP
jgi:DNA anti-recombination protein RmuC